VQQILDDQGNVACEALFTIGLFDMTARKLIPPNAAWLKALGLTDADVQASG
jgi:hypothetical protein